MSTLEPKSEKLKRAVKLAAGQRHQPVYRQFVDVGIAERMAELGRILRSADDIAHGVGEFVHRRTPKGEQLHAGGIVFAFAPIQARRDVQVVAVAVLVVGCVLVFKRGGLRRRRGRGHDHVVRVAFAFELPHFLDRAGKQPGKFVLLVVVLKSQPRFGVGIVFQAFR